MFKRIIDRIIDNEVAKRKIEVEQRLKVEEDNLKLSYQQKISELSSLNDKLNRQIQEVERTRLSAETEQKRLWERLDVLKDNLNTEDVWIKLWECAYSKAVDVVWSLMRDNSSRLIEFARKDGYDEAERRLARIYDKRLNEAIEKSSDKINAPLLFKKKDEAQDNYLQAQKAKDITRENYFKGQVELIKEVLK